jgi:dolichyl-phosphate beta-glucosyltransferase
MSVSIIIPAYNEEVRLPMTLGATADYFAKLGDEFEILVVNDGSRDGTERVVTEYAAAHPQFSIQCLSYGGNHGKGYAVRYGMLRGKGSLRLFCDADLATPAEEYEVLLKGMRDSGADIAIGSRPLRESNLLVHQPWYRELGGRCFNKIVQRMAIPGIDDTQCGFKLFTAAATEDVFSLCKLDRFAFDIEALYIANKLGYKITEIPIRWAHKDGSKVNMLRDGLKTIKDVAMIRRMHRSLKDRAAGSSKTPVLPKS